MKHTPTPWRTIFTGTGWTVNYNGPDHHWLIATVNETPAIGHHSANARLIAAAPDLLAVCKELFNLLEEHEPIWYLKGHYNRASDAIAKAEGSK